MFKPFTPAILIITQQVTEEPVITCIRVKSVQVKYSQPLGEIKIQMYACNTLKFKITNQRRKIYSMTHVIKLASKKEYIKNTLIIYQISTFVKV